MPIETLESEPRTAEPARPQVEAPSDLAWVRQVLSGALVPRPMSDAAVTAEVERHFAERRPADQPPPSARARQAAEDDLNLSRLHGGEVVACARARSATEHLVVLAVGHDAVRALLAQLTGTERNRVAVTFPPPVH
jgi:hypothetical protein